MPLINDVFHTLQGEGFWTGRPAVFIRFAKCNLWNGHEEDRHLAICQFCDTDFVKGKRTSIESLLDSIHLMQPDDGRRMVVLTGGEPLLQVNSELVRGLHTRGWYVAVETNGTIDDDLDLDWVCVSPKAGAPFHRTHGNELKLVFPQEGMDPRDYEGLDFAHFWISPMDGPNYAQNLQHATEFVLKNPQWRLNIQTHKVIGVK